ncbi:hypothetical protein CISIN_1g037908mg [Citrus sinensis]|uniref:Uncharacterized protein n=1 Tax=Citrus sinensis TaxID=2711 RepID=A0A067H967_CITSI|nr:hypothetical protein CISIN_1g037908mg [Citrus sinensis]
MVSPLRPWPKWWAAALTSIVRAAVLAPTKALWGLNVLYILLPCEMQVEYGHLSCEGLFVLGMYFIEFIVIM